jgi:hypothetical protein
VPNPAGVESPRYIELISLSRVGTDDQKLDAQLRELPKDHA